MIRASGENQLMSSVHTTVARVQRANGVDPKAPASTRGPSKMPEMTQLMRHLSLAGALLTWRQNGRFRASLLGPWLQQKRR